MGDWGAQTQHGQAVMTTPCETSETRASSGRGDSAVSINRSGRHFRRKHLAAVAATAAMGRRRATGDWRSVAGVEPERFSQTPVACGDTGAASGRLELTLGWHADQRRRGVERTIDGLMAATACLRQPLIPPHCPLTVCLFMCARCRCLVRM